MNQQAVASVPGRGGVTLGYIAAAGMAAALWLGIGILLIPLMVVLALIHFAAGAGGEAVVASHHRWLGRHHGLSAFVLVFVLIAPLFALPALFETGMVVLNTLAYAPYPIETLAAAWPELELGTLLLALAIFLFGWLLATLWITIRVIRRWLRWIDRRPA